MLTGDVAHAARRRHHILGRDRSAIGQGHGLDALHRPNHAEHGIERVRGNIHQAVAAVVALAAALHIAQIADPALGNRRFDRLQRAAAAPLVMHGHLHPFLRGFGQHRVGLGQGRANRLLNVDVDSVLQHSHSERIVELSARGNGDDVRGLGLDHPVEIVVAGRNP